MLTFVLKHARHALPGLFAWGGALSISIIAGAQEAESLAALPGWKRHAVDATSRGADGTRLADVNGDGLLDIATGWEEGGQVRAYLHPGAKNVRRPWPYVTAGRVQSAEDAVFADVDADGRADVVSSCEGRTQSLFIHWAPEDPHEYLRAAAWQTEAIPLSRGTRWMFCVPMDVDGRHGIDLVAGAKGSGARVGWLEAPRTPRQLDDWRWHPLCRAGWIMSILPADMDGDGDDDLLVSDRKGPRRGCLWLENPGAAAVARSSGEWTEHRIGPVNVHEVMFLDWADIDGDGRRDVASAVAGRKLLVHLRQPGPKVAWKTHELAMPAGTGRGKCVTAGDIDLDGTPDLVVSCETARGVAGVFYMTRAAPPVPRGEAHGGEFSEARWEPHAISGREGTKFDLVRLVDLDGDGDLDVLTSEERENLGVVWFENPRR